MADASVLFNAVLIEPDEDLPELGAVLVPGRAQHSMLYDCSTIASSCGSAMPSKTSDASRRSDISAS